MPDHYAAIHNVVVDTFLCWSVRRIGFSWEKYYLDHTLQVQSLAVRMARETGADPDRVRLAAILHDISKRYDGAILKDTEGNVVRDDEGFWLNETVAPARSNWVTEAYDRMGLTGQIHHLSGAALAQHILDAFGYARGEVEQVGRIVRGHLKGRVPPQVHDERYREVETRLLYDADTIDPNVGYTAFYRNVQINAGHALERGEPVDLDDYVRRLPRWIEMKENFPDQMLTERGRDVCRERLERNRSLVARLHTELEEGEIARRFGLLGVVAYLFTNPENPSLREHARGLRSDWLPARDREAAALSGDERSAALEALARSRTFADLLQHEMDGEA